MKKSSIPIFAGILIVSVAPIAGIGGDPHPVSRPFCQQLSE
jgi:hypothetical protein